MLVAALDDRRGEDLGYELVSLGMSINRVWLTVPGVSTPTGKKINCCSRSLYLLRFLTSAAPAAPPATLPWGGYWTQQVTSCKEQLKKESRKPEDIPISIGPLPIGPASARWFQYRQNAIRRQGLTLWHH